MLLGTDKDGRTAWHKAKGGPIQRFYKIIVFAKENLTTEEINNELLYRTEKDGMTASPRAARWSK